MTKKQLSSKREAKRLRRKSSQKKLPLPTPDRFFFLPRGLRETTTEGLHRDRPGSYSVDPVQAVRSYQLRAAMEEKNPDIIDFLLESDPGIPAKDVEFYRAESARIRLARESEAKPEPQSLRKILFKGQLANVLGVGPVSARTVQALEGQQNG